MTFRSEDATAPARILIVDDERVIREVLCDFLEMEGHEVRTASHGAEALALLEREHFSLILSDLKMPGMGGLELLGAMQERHIDVLPIIMTGFGTVESAISAMKNGAYDYILKPFRSDEVIQVVRRALERQRIREENIRLREALSLYKVSEAMGGSLHVDDVLETILEAASSETGADSVMLYHRGRVSDRWNVRMGRHRSEASPEVVLDPAAIHAALASQGGLLVRGADVAPFARCEDPAGVPTELMAAALRIKGVETGLLTVTGHSARRHFNEGRSKVLQLLASRAATAIENARLHEELQDVFRQTLTGLTLALEARDMYTAGHSDRVSTYAAWVAEGLGMSREQSIFVREAGLLHDIGKIGIDTQFLNKPGKLTEYEYELFKSHVTLSKRILEPIRFLKDVIPGAYCHHEKYDGTGYPQSLAGKDIPLLGRIIAVADTWDAMTSDRPYRQALKYDTALRELHTGAGTQFDPEIVSVFVGQVEQHKAIGHPVHASQFRPRRPLAERMQDDSGEWEEDFPEVPPGEEPEVGAPDATDTHVEVP